MTLPTWSERKRVMLSRDNGVLVHAMGGTPVSSGPLKAPFPYPGGKSRVADLIWDRFGKVDNYVEPFAGTLAVLLRRPAEHFRGGYRVETANDVNHYLVNFWRAVRAAPEAVAEWSDWPVAEADLHARHKWLVRSREAADFREKVRTDPEHFDAKIAGWWVWGQCCWIGGAWCAHKVDQSAMPLLDPSQKGVHSAQGGPVEQGVLGGRPQLTDAYDLGRGVNSGAAELSVAVPRLGACYGQPSAPGVLNPAAGEAAAKLPRLADHERKPATGVCNFFGPPPGTCDARRAWLVDWMRRLSDRLRLVRTCYGHWARVCDSDSTLTRLGTTGVFLDPPYPARRSDTGGHSRDASLYASDQAQDLDKLRDEVLAWCRKWCGDRLIRAAVCGYEGDGYEALEDEGWRVHFWEASGGYGNQRRAGKGKAANARRERIWFSPHCVNLQPGLFDGPVNPESCPA